MHIWSSNFSSLNTENVSFHMILHNLSAPQASVLMAGYEKNCKLALKCEPEKIKRKIGSGGN